MSVLVCSHSRLALIGQRLLCSRLQKLKVCIFHVVLHGVPVIYSDTIISTICASRLTDLHTIMKEATVQCLPSINRHVYVHSLSLYEAQVLLVVWILRVCSCRSSALLDGGRLSDIPSIIWSALILLQICWLEAVHRFHAQSHSSRYRLARP